MHPEDFVKEIRRSIINDNLELYRDLFENTKSNQVTDDYWIKALSLFSKLEPEDREIFFSVIRQITVDTISNLFAILDGSATLGDKKNEFNLAVKNDIKEKLNGELQDIFLEIEEQER